VNPGATMVASYNQSITDKLQAGFELAHSGKMAQTMFTTGFRYMFGIDSIVTGNSRYQISNSLTLKFLKKMLWNLNSDVQNLCFKVFINVTKKIRDHHWWSLPYDFLTHYIPGIYSPSAIGGTYSRQLSDKFGLSTELMLLANPNTASWETLASVGYEYRLLTGSVKGHLDTSGRVSGFLEEHLSQNMKINFCAELDHSKREYHFGIGATMNI
jgi:hypothetical protein